MADSVIKVIIQLEALNLVSSPGGSGEERGTAAPSGSRAGFDVDASAVKKEFDTIVSSLRSFTQSISQINEAIAALKQGSATATATAASAAPPPPQPTPRATTGIVDASGRAFSEASEKAASAAKEAASATNTSTGATNDSTKATDSHADSLKDEAEAAAKAAAATSAFTKTLLEFQQHQQRGTPESAAFRDIDKPDKGGSTAAARIKNVFEPIATDPSFRAQAAKLKAAEGFVKVDERITGEAKVEADKFAKEIVDLLKDADRRLEAAKNATDVAGIQSQTVREIDTRIRDRGGRSSGVDFKEPQFSGSFKTAEFIKVFTILEDALERFASAKLAGKVGSELDSIVREVEIAESKLTKLTAKETVQNRRQIFTVPNAGSPGETVDFQPRVREFIHPDARTNVLSSVQRQIVDLAKAASGTLQPLDKAREVFRLLSTESDKFEDNMRAIKEALRGVVPANFAETIDFAKFEDLKKLINISKSSSGVIRGPNAVAAGEASAIFGSSRINQLRQELAGGVRGATKSETIAFTDSSGNVRRVNVELKQLGRSLDTVRVKAKEVSDNMFDRASVRTALQRVATWGAAAGLVFGAVSAFKSGITTVVDTEFAIANLAKVMDEAQANFEGFKQSATSTAIAIAQDFGQPLKDVIETMITFAQQGKNLAEVTALTRASALAANVTTLDQPTAGSVLTAVTAQFNMDPVKDATSIIDKFNNVANNAAVTETQLADALKKAGNAAVNAGVDLDQFNGIVAAISQQTRQSGAEIGTALKFVFARINTEKAEKGLAAIGVSARDAEGAVRPFMDIVGDLNRAFEGLSESQQTQVAISIAGARQFNTFLALIKNFSQFQDSTADSVNSAGSALREQSRIAETAHFKIQQLKNSVSATAVSFGSAFLPILKSATSVAKGFFDALSGVPSQVTLIGTSLALAGIAFTKFSNQMVSFIDLFDKGAAKKGIFGTIAGSLAGPGISLDQQIQKDPASIARFSQAGSGVLIARTVSDLRNPLAKVVSESDDFIASLSKANLKLVDINGNVVKNTAGMTKFAAVTRGLGTASQFDASDKAINRVNLGVAALNSGFTRLAATVVKFSAAASRIGLIGFGIDFLEKRFSGANAGAVSLAANLTRVVAAGVGIYLAVKAFSFLKDATLESGETIRNGLEEEIAARQQSVEAIRKQAAEVNKLSKAREAAALNAAKDATIDSDLRDESIRRGSFKSPLLDEQRLRKQSIDTSNNIGIAHPELILRVDEFGNAVLRSAASFDTLAASATSAHTQILAATQIKVIEGFIKDLDGSATDGFFKSIGRGFARGTGAILQGLSLGFADNPFAETGADEGEKFRNRLKEFEELSNDPRVKESLRLGVDLSLVDSDFSEELDEKAKELSDAGIKFREVIQKINDEIANIPEDAIGQLFKSKDFKVFASTAARLISSELGKTVTEGQFSQKLLLQNKSENRPVRNLIGITGSETQALFNERGILQRAFEVRENVAEQLKSLKGGELVILESLLGTREQLKVEVDDFGDRLVEVVNEKTNEIELLNLADLIKEGDITKVISFDISAVKQQLDTVASELGRVVSGGARGSLLSQDLDLGNLRKFQSTSQQRASFGNEQLVSDLRAAKEAIEVNRQDFKSRIDAGDAGNVSLAAVFDFNQLAIREDTLATIFKFKSEIEEVGRAFEESLDKIDSQALREKITSQFSGILGAGRGAIDNRAGRPLLKSELSGEQVFQTSAQGIIAASNTLADSEKAIGQFLAGRADIARSISLATREFESANGPGGIRDPKRLTEISRRATDRANAGIGAADNLLAAIAEDQRDEAKIHTGLFKELISTIKDPAALSGGILAATQIAKTGGPEAINELASRIRAISPEKLADTNISTASLTAAAKTLQGQTPDNLRTELIARKAGEAASTVASGIIQRKGLGEEKSEEGFLSRLFGKRVPLFSEEQRAESTRNAIKPLQSELGDIFNKAAQSPGKVTNEAAAAAALAVAEVLKKSPSSEVAESGERLEEAVKEGNKEIIETFRQNIEGTRAIPRGETTTPPAELKRSATEENRVIQEHTSRMLEAVNVLNKFIDPIRTAQGALLRLAEDSAKLGVSIRDVLAGAITSIKAASDLGSLASSTQAGALAGLSSVGFDTGKTLRDLSGEDITSLENQNLVKSGNDAKTALSGITESITLLSKQRSVVAQLREEALAAGNTTGVSAADKALELAGSQMDLLRVQGTGLADSLNKLGGSFNNLKVINQLRVDVEKMLESFQRARDFEVDTTSIDTALGRTPFSFTRPSFEQFQQGQGGRLTRFERASADIDFKQKSGELSAADAATARQRAEFDNNEEIIALAQQKENKRFENEISVAQQIMSKLVDFSASSSSISSEAEKLANDLKEELGEAGDIIKGEGGSRTIRDPRTGQEVDVPASEVLQFRGVRGLDEVKDRIRQLSAQAKSEEQSANAALINQPIVDTLQSTSDTVVGKLEELIKTLSEDPANKQSTDAQGVINKLVEALPGFITGLDNFTTNISNLFSAFKSSDKGDPTTSAPTSSARETSSTTKEVRISEDDIKRLMIQAANTPVKGFATGGIIKGPGGPKEDKVPVMASPGEFIVQASAVKKLGVSALSSLNQGKFPQRFNEGGLVGSFDDLDEEEVRKAEELLATRRGALQSKSEVPNEFGLNVKKEDTDDLLRAERGKEIRFYGPSFNGSPVGIVTESDLEKRRLEAAQNKVKAAPSDDQIAALHVKARQEGLKSRSQGKGLILSESHPGFSVVFDKGRPVFTNSGEGIPLDGRIIGMDLTTEKSFNRDEKRRANIAALSNLRTEALAEEKAIEAERLKRVRGNFGSLKLGTVSDLTKESITANTQRFFRDINEQVRVLNSLVTLMETPEGRESLRAENKYNEDRFYTASSRLSNLMEYIPTLEKRAVSVNHPVNNTVETITEALFGRAGFVSDDGRVSGDVFEANDELFNSLNTTEIDTLIKAARVASDYARESQFTFSKASLSGFNDFLQTSKYGGDGYLGPGLRNLAAITVGAVKGAKGFAEGSINLIPSIAKGSVKLGESLGEKGFVGTAKAGASAAVDIAGGVGRKVLDTATGVFSSDEEKSLAAFSNLGQAYSTVALGALTAPGSAVLAKGFVSGARSGFSQIGKGAIKAPGAIARGARGLKSLDTKAVGDAFAKIPPGKVPDFFGTPAAKAPAVAGAAKGPGFLSGPKASKAIDLLAGPEGFSKKAIAKFVARFIPAGVVGALGAGVPLLAALTVPVLGAKVFRGVKNFFGSVKTAAAVDGAVGISPAASALRSIDNIDLGPAGRGGPIITPPPTGPPPVGQTFYGGVNIGAAQARRSANSPFASILSPIKLPGKGGGPLLGTPLKGHIEGSGFQFRTENLAEHIKNSRFVNSSLGVVDESFGGSAVGSSLSQGSGAFNAAARGGTSTRIAPINLAKEFSKALNKSSPSVSRTGGPAALRRPGQTGGLSDTPDLIEDLVAHVNKSGFQSRTKPLAEHANASRFRLRTENLGEHVRGSGFFGARGVGGTEELAEHIARSQFATSLNATQTAEALTRARTPGVAEHISRSPFANSLTATELKEALERARNLRTPFNSPEFELTGNPGPFGKPFKFAKSTPRRGARGRFVGPESVESHIANSPFGKPDPAAPIAPLDLTKVNFDPAAPVAPLDLRNIRAVDKGILDRRFDRSTGFDSGKFNLGGRDPVSGEIQSRILGPGGGLGGPSVIVNPALSKIPGTRLNNARALADAEAAGANLGIDPKKAIQNQLVERLRLKKLEGQRGSTGDMFNFLAKFFAKKSPKNVTPVLQPIPPRGPATLEPRRGSRALINLQASRAERAFSLRAQRHLEALQGGKDTRPFRGPDDSRASAVAEESKSLTGANSPAARRRLLEKEKEKELKDFIETLAGKKKFAFGGMVFGPGGPREDKVPILASAGEFVMNSDAVKKLGVPFMDFMNKNGAVPKFADGGLVGSSSGASGSMEIKVDTREISSAISSGMKEALSNSTVSLNIPSGGVPIDVSALKNAGLGDSLGAAVRNRLESVEGSVASLREDTNAVLDKVESVESRLDAQKQELLDKMFTEINEQLNNLQGITAGVDARLAKHEAETGSRFTNIENQISVAISIANEALSRSLARI